MHRILRNRSYIGGVPHRGESVPGTHPPLVDRPTFAKVQKLLRGITYRSHELVFGSALITCGHCGRAVCGERKTKKTKSGPKDYIYYFCTHHKKPDHPSCRVRESQLDEQLLALFRSLRIKDAKVRDWCSRRCVRVCVTTRTATSSRSPNSTGNSRSSAPSRTSCSTCVCLTRSRPTPTNARAPSCVNTPTN